MNLMNVFDPVTQYFRGAVMELRQVRWPTRHQAVRLSSIVVVFTLVAAALYGLVDFVLGRIIAFLLDFA